MCTSVPKKVCEYTYTTGILYIYIYTHTHIQVPKQIREYTQQQRTGAVPLESIGIQAKCLPFVSLQDVDLSL